MGRGKIILNGVEYGGVDITSELSSTSTNNEAAGAKAVYDELSALNTELGNKVTSSQFSAALQTKVSVVNGKGLSTNDYTNDEKTKLAGLQNTTVDSALSTTSTNPVQNKIVTAELNKKANSTDVATALQTKVSVVDGKGLSTNDYTTAEKNKLAGLSNTVVDSALSATSTNPVQNKVVNTALSNKVDKVSGKGLSTNDYTTAEKNKLAGLETYVASQVAAAGHLTKSIVTTLPTVANAKENVIYMIKDSTASGDVYKEYMKIGSAIEQIGDTSVDLSPYAKTADVNTALAKKVDAVSGKGLSTNDYTTAEKNKLAGLSNTVVDSALSTTSTNPVQNKIVTAALNGKAASSHTHNYAGSSSAGGVATSAAKLATARTIALSGDVSGSTTFDGSGNASIEASLADEITVDKLYIGSQKAQIYESSTGPTSYSLYIQPAKNESIYLVNGSHYTIAGYSTSKGVILGEMSKYLDVGIYGKTITVDGPITFNSDISSSVSITCSTLTASTVNASEIYVGSNNAYIGQRSSGSETTASLTIDPGSNYYLRLCDASNNAVFEWSKSDNNIKVGGGYATILNGSSITANSRITASEGIMLPSGKPIYLAGSTSWYITTNSSYNTFTLVANSQVLISATAASEGSTSFSSNDMNTTLRGKSYIKLVTKPGSTEYTSMSLEGTSVYIGTRGTSTNTNGTSGYLNIYGSISVRSANYSNNDATSIYSDYITVKEIDGMYNSTYNHIIYFGTSDGNFISYNNSTTKGWVGLYAKNKNSTVAGLKYGVDPADTSYTKMAFYPDNTGVYNYLGSDSKKFDAIYCANAAIQTSDRNAKHDIEYVDLELGYNIVEGLKPSRYRMNRNESNRIHYGFISQDVEETVNSLGIDTTDFAAITKTRKKKEVEIDDARIEKEVDPETGESKEIEVPCKATVLVDIPEGEEGYGYNYGLRYDELLAPIVAHAQYLSKKVNSLEDQLAKALERITALENK